MKKLKEFVEENALVLAVILFCLFTRLFLYRPAPPGWDESTYIQIGKYLFSAGKIGFLEPLRPLLWPVFLGSLWKMNLDPVIFGHALTLLCSLANIIFVYLIGNRVYGRGTGILAALLLGMSPSFFSWGNSMLTEIPASFLGLLSFYLVLKERYFFSGLVGMLAFAMKFVHLFTFIPIAGVVFFRSLSRRSSGLKTPLVSYVLGCIPAVIALAGAHFVLYGDLLLPFTDARLVYGQVPFGWIEGIQCALTALWKTEGGLLIFIPLAVFLGRRSLTEERMVVLAVALLQFLWVGKLPTELSRFFCPPCRICIF